MSASKSLIYAIGGYSNEGTPLSSASIYDPSLDSWTAVPDFFDNGRSSITAAFHHDSIFMFGCEVCCADHSDKLDSVQRIRLDGSNRSPIETLVSSMGASSIHSVAVLQDKIYASGLDDSDEKLFSVLEQNPENGSFTFSPATPMISSARFSRLVALGDFLYSLGGLLDGIPDKTVERYSPLTHEWEFLSNMNNAHDYRCQAASLDGKLYVCSQHGFETFDLETEIWTDLPMPNREYFDQKMVACAGKLYLIGSWTSKVVEEFDPSTGLWRFRAEMDTIHDFCAVVAVEM